MTTDPGTGHTATTPLWIAVRIILHERGAELFTCWQNVLKTRDPEDIHDLRVASRRLREGLTLFSPCYPARTIEAIDKRVKKHPPAGSCAIPMRRLFFTALAEEVSSPACCDELLAFVDETQGKRKWETRRMVSGLRKMDRKGLFTRYQRVINKLSLFSPSDRGVDLLAPLSGFAAAAFDSPLHNPCGATGAGR